MKDLLMLWLENDSAAGYLPVWFDCKLIERIEPNNETTSLVFFRGEQATKGGEVIYGSAYDLATYVYKPNCARPTPPRELRRGYDCNGIAKSAEQLGLEVAK